MKFTSLVFGVSLFASSVFAHPLGEPFDDSYGNATILDHAFSQEALDKLEKRASTFAITGVPGSTYPRLEVSQMFANKPNQWTLFILAMQSFQAQSQSTSTSYYQIAGIHGVPRQNWDGVGQCSSCSGTDGYCTHDSVLFPAWHRVYMALFEQEFMTVVNSIAASYPAGSKRTAMQGAASTMRFPFWDWAAQPGNGGPTMPVILTEKTITVTAPSGSETINNPLYRHYFSDTSGLVYSPFTNWIFTLRYPSSDASSASSTESTAISAMNNIRSSLQDQVYQLFTTCTDYLHFSNDDAGSSSTSCSNSLEGIHNTVHSTTGGGGSSTVSGGHMNYLSLAAFDPIFWLHHANVDRLFALWQTINPSSYGASQTAPHNTWTIAQGSTQNADSALTPFHKDTAGTFWTTNMVKSWASTFHYTYPEFSDSSGSKAAIVSYVNKLYGPSATATAGSSKRTAAPEPNAAAAAEATPAAEIPHLAQRGGSPVTAQNGSMFQYVANINSPRYVLNGSYYIYLFNGAPASEDPTTWITDSNLIGPMGVVAMPGMTNNDLVAAGSIPLTRTLTAEVKSGALSDLTEAKVGPYLKKNLIWRIMGPDGTEVDPSTLTNFELAVFASTSTPPPDVYTLPKWSAFVPMLEITQNKAGGANSTVGIASRR